MLKLMRKMLDIAGSEVLWDFDADGNFERDWRGYSGDWSRQDGWLTGYNPHNAPGVLLSRRTFPDNILLDFEAATIPPSDHDIDWMWNARWDEGANARGQAYVGGFQGWWDGKIGIEKSPAYTLTATAPAPGFVPGQVYHILSGNFGGHCFAAVDGRLAIELTDPEHETHSSGGHIGFEAYASHIRIRRVRVLRAAWTPVEDTYPALKR